MFVSSRKGISRAARSSSNSLAPGTGRDETWSTPSTSKSHPRSGANGESVILRVNTVYAPQVSPAPLRPSPRRHNHPASRTCPDHPVHWGHSSGSGSRPILQSTSPRHRRCIRSRLPCKGCRSGYLLRSSRSSRFGRTHPPRSYSGMGSSSPGTGARGRYLRSRSVRARQDSRRRRRSRSGQRHRRRPSHCHTSTPRRCIPGGCTCLAARSGQVLRGARGCLGST